MKRASGAPVPWRYNATETGYTPPQMPSSGVQPRVSVGDPAGQATVFGGAVVGGTSLSWRRTVAQVAATRPVAVGVTGALKWSITPLSGTAPLVACASLGRVVDAVVEGQLDVEVADRAGAAPDGGGEREPRGVGADPRRLGGERERGPGGGRGCTGAGSVRRSDGRTARRGGPGAPRPGRDGGREKGMTSPSRKG